MPEKLRPIQDYLKHQGRFRHLSPEQIQAFQDRTNLEYKKLLNKIEHSKSWGEMSAE